MFKGSMVALVTPMNQMAEVDYKALKRLINFHLAEGTDAIVVNGTTAESPCLSAKEQIKIIEFCAKAINGERPLIAGTGSSCTKKTLQASLDARQAGAKACMIVSPAYNKPTQNGIIKHYETILEALDAPIIIYNVPSRTASMIELPTITRLAKHKQVVALKETVTDKEHLKALMLLKSKINLIGGDDASALSFILQGGVGLISVTANIRPKLVTAMIHAALEGRIQEAASISARLMPLHKALMCSSNPIPIKWALENMGLINGQLRLPLLPLEKEYQAGLLSAMKACPA